jgi:hypothetical protein
MLRLTLGLGYGTTSASADIAGAADVDISGLSGSFAIDLGGAVTENLVIHARMSDLSMVNPNVSVDGMDLGDADETSLTAFLFGPAITYYLMPANVYLTAAIGISWLRITNWNTDRAAATDIGFGLNADIGKEWWVSDDWGLGVAGRFWFTHTSESAGGVDFNYDLPGFAILFSATFQ